MIFRAGHLNTVSCLARGAQSNVSLRLYINIVWAQANFEVAPSVYLDVTLHTHSSIIALKKASQCVSRGVSVIYSSSCCLEKLISKHAVVIPDTTIMKEAMS